VTNDCPLEDDLWEQQVIIIDAPTETDARIQAEQMGRRKEHEYISVTGDRVRWVFRCVETVFELFDEQLKHGTEVYSRFLRASDVRSLMKRFEGEQ
jgi:hypothetical protein